MSGKTKNQTREMVISRRNAKVRNSYRLAPIVKVGVDEDGRARYMRGENMYQVPYLTVKSNEPTSKY
jgi:hypothetical protein